ncbi:hypothetical protein ACLMJK_005444 [Lecanora helva]
MTITITRAETEYRAARDYDDNITVVASGRIKELRQIENVIKNTTIDPRYNRQMDHLLHDLFSVKPEHAVPGEQTLAKHIRQTSLWREDAYAALMWRLQLQDLVLMAFRLLHTHGLVSVCAMKHDIDLENPDWRVWHVVQALSQFQFVRFIYRPPVIAMCERLEPILDLLERSRVFGRFDREAFRLRWMEGTELRVDKHAMRPRPTNDPLPKQLAFYLPMSKRTKGEAWDAMYDLEDRRREAFEVFKRYFHIGKYQIVGFRGAHVPPIEQQNEHGMRGRGDVRNGARGLQNGQQNGHGIRDRGDVRNGARVLQNGHHGRRDEGMLPNGNGVEHDRNEIVNGNGVVQNGNAPRSRISYFDI